MTTKIAAIAACVLLAGAASAADLNVRVTPNTTRLTPYSAFELTFQHEGKYADPTWDVTIEGEFTSPAGSKSRVGGFFYGSSKPSKPIVTTVPGGQGRARAKEVWPLDPADLWKLRYAPGEPGEWKYSYVFANKAGESAKGSGAFQVVKGRAKPKGWLRVSPDNPYRLVYEDGSPFWPVGLQKGPGDPEHLGSLLAGMGMEGPFRLGAGRPKTPPGAMFVRGPGMGSQNGDVYFGRHARAGFNLWRFSPNNATPVKLFARPEDQTIQSREHVRWEQARAIDEMLRTTGKYGIRNLYGFFGYMDVCALDVKSGKDKQGRPVGPELEKVKRLIQYSVDRWGAYVDIWQFLNEQKADAEWYAVMIPYLKSVDPYHKPICTSWERPEIDGIDLNTPHAYTSEDELTSDKLVAGWATRHKKAGKPVIFGEQGNNVPRGRMAELGAKGIGGVWDPGSARRMRVRLWSALFNEIALVFWETSYARDGHFMNQWIGSEERQYVKALQGFAAGLDRGVRMVRVGLAGASAARVRAYGLRSPTRAAVYLHQFACDQCAAPGVKPARHPLDQPCWDHDRGQVKDLKVTIDLPKAATGYWYNPIDATILGRFDAPAGDGTFAAPPFTVDLALLITEAGCPDSDRDGVANDADDDNDNDGVPNARDAFPLEREETADVDKDRIGDGLDADIDADGKADDLNKDGVPDNEETDWDGDGVPQGRAVPWDAFPRDPKEWRDTDGDGIGDNADMDDDGDGYTDAEEKAAGTDPLSPLHFPDKP